MQDEHKNDMVPKQAEGLIAVIGLGISVLLMAMAPFVTKLQPADKPWFLAPVIGPLVALAVMALPAAVLSLRWRRSYRRAPSPSAYMQQSRWAFGDFTSAVEYGIYFCAYLWAIHYVGFAISTFLFGQLCLYRSGLRSIDWLYKNLLFTAVVVLVLRVFLGLWFPMAPLFKLLPSAIGNVLGTYL